MLGRNWLEKLTLNWKAIYGVSVYHLQAILNQHSEVLNLEWVPSKITKLVFLLTQQYPKIL